MEKSTVKALIIAGATLLGAIAQVVVLAAARRGKKAKGDAAAGDAGPGDAEAGPPRDAGP
jgi:hypothetical protein